MDDSSAAPDAGASRIPLGQGCLDRRHGRPTDGPVTTAERAV